MTEKGLFNRVVGYLLGTDKKIFQEVQIDREVVHKMLQIARESHPHEFIALLQGKVKDRILRIEGLIFLPGETSNQGAVMKIFMMPLLDDAVGAVHSHPIPNATPSQADLHFFSKNGLFHLIIAQPYNEDSIIAYNSFGERIYFGVV